MLTMGTIISLLDPFDALAPAPPPQAPLNFRSRRSASLGTISKAASCRLDQHQRQKQQQVIYLEQAADQSLAPTGRQQASASSSRRATAHAQQQAPQNESVAAGGGEQQRAAAPLAQRSEQREHKQQQQQRQQQKNKERAATMRAATTKEKTKTKTTTHQQAASRQVDASKRESLVARSSLASLEDTCKRTAAQIESSPRKLEQAAELVEHLKKSSLIKLGEQATRYSRVGQSNSSRKTMTVLSDKHSALGPVVSSPNSPSTTTNMYHHNHQQVAGSNQNHLNSSQHHHQRRSFQGSCIMPSQALNHQHNHQNPQKIQQRQQQIGQQRRDNQQQRSLSTCSSLASSAGSANGSTSNMLQQITTYHKAPFFKTNNKSTALRHYLHNHHQHNHNRHQHHNHSSASSTVSSSDDSSGLPESGPPTPDHQDRPRPPPLPAKQMMQLLCSKAAAELMTFTTTGDIELPAAHLAWWQWCRSLGTLPANDHPSVHPVPPPRRWLYRKGHPQSRYQQHGEFTVLSYNVLANRLVNSKMFPSSPLMALNWFYRRELILRQLVEFDADIVALQEVEQQHYDNFFRPHMESRGYGCLFGPKSRFKTMDVHKRSTVDGCAIFYKLQKFSLVQQHLLEYNQIAMANAKGSEAMLNRVMTKDNIGLAAILEMNSDNPSVPSKQLLVCNTHIHWDPEYCDVKLIQTIMLMNELECIAKHHTGSQSTSPNQLFGGDALNGTSATTNDLMPLVLLGDFNSMPNSGVATYLTEGKIDSLHEDFKNEKYTSCSNALAIRTAQLLEQQQLDGLTTRRQSSPAWCFYHQQPASPTTSTSSTSSSSSSSYRSSLSMDVEKKILNYQHEFKLASAYDEHLMPYTNYTCNFKAMIDYIFYSQHSLELVGLLGPFDKDWFRKSGIQGLPQAHLPSDHLPLLAKLSLAGSRSSSSSSSHQINHQNQSY